MKPIGQTFFVNEPPAPTGVQGVYITRIDVYFQSVSSQFGVQMEIRETDNGAPTPNRLPFASKVILPSDTVTSSINALQPDLTVGNAIIRASADASIATPFIFDTPVFVQSGKSYAFVVIPLGGNPFYNIWTAEVGQNDALTKAPIFTNNDSGDLFLSSNDLTWIPVINEDIKYTIYTANFTSLSGDAYYRAPDEDWVQFKDPTGSFLMREPLAFSNSYVQTATFTISGVSGTFSPGDTVYQSVGSANVSAVVYSVSGSTVKVANATGAFSVTTAGSPLLYDATSSANASVDAVSQNVSTTSACNVITVPDSSKYATNQVIYLQTSNRSTSQVVKINSIPTGTTLVANSPMNFTDTNALIGTLIANGALTGQFSGSVYLGDRHYTVLDNISSNTAVNLSGVTNRQIIGLSSGVSANLIVAHDPAYNSLTTHFTSVAPGNTALTYSIKGFANDSIRTPDTDFIPISDGLPNEFIDVERIAMSRSNELGLLPAGRAGNSSLVLKASMVSQNNKITPAIDSIQNNITYTYNIVAQDYELSGCYLSINTNSGTFTKGDVVSQTSYGNTTTGIIHHANSTYIMVTNVNGKFSSCTAFTTSNSVTGYVFNAEDFNEAGNNGYFKSSRYISKNIILAPGQDAEDIRAYLAAFRPANTNLHVYAKVLNTIDTETFDKKAWSKLTEISPASLQSSKVNVDDQVELVYGFPTSQNIFVSNTVVNSNPSNTTIVCQSTAGITNNSFIYTSFSNSSVSYYNVRQVVYVVNSTALKIDRPTSFTNPNASLGIIPGLESTTSAFLNDENNNIVRYVTYNDAVYDSYIQFAIKIVTAADNSYLVPRVGDLRVLALQV